MRIPEQECQTASQMPETFYKDSENNYGDELHNERWPAHLKIQITNRCNLRCCMCGIHANDAFKPFIKYKDMSGEILKRLEPVISKTHYITLTGGEPTISHNFLQKVRRIRQLNPNAHLTIITNGVTLSSREFAEEMIPLFNCIHLSLNGTKNYGKITIINQFENIKRSFENIRLVRNNLQKPSQFIVGFVLMRKNLEDIVEAAILAKDMKADEIWYKDLWVHNNSMKQESARHSQKLYSLMLEKIQEASQLGIAVRCELGPQLCGQKTAPPPAENTQNRTITCREPWKRVKISHNGAAVLCCNGFTYIGNIKEKNFEDIWLGKEAQRYREGLITGHFYKDCARCKVIFRDELKNYEKTGKNFLKKKLSSLLYFLRDKFLV